MKHVFMVKKYNPFRPSSPVYNNMFIGRMEEIDNIDASLFQTKNGNPNHIIFTGERGIGKTSLLILANFFAKGEIPCEETIYNFLTVQINLTNKMSILDLVISLKKQIEREVSQKNPENAFIKKCWAKISKFEACGIKYKGNGNEVQEQNQLIEDFIYALVDTVKGITGSALLVEMGLKEKMDGLVILIDEADNASPELDLGVFLKKINEVLIVEGCNNVMFVLAGLPTLFDVLNKSHESSLRLFKEYYLPPLTKIEVNTLIKDGLKESSEKSGISMSIDNNALDLIYEYSEGYPHFVQQIGFSTFELNNDEKIDSRDVKFGFFSKNGALNSIGERYYKKLYYSDISVESQREILDIMAKKWNVWVTREYISSQYKHKSLDTCIRALKEKKIILSREGQRGQYRLQYGSFAFWIKNHKKIESR